MTHRRATHRFVPPDRYRPRWLGLLIVATLLAHRPAAAQPTDASDPPVPGPVQAEALVVRDLSVFLLDRYSDVANSARDYPSTLFNGAYRRRRGDTTPGGGPPMPLGMITFDGAINEPRRVQLELPGTEPGNQFLGHWPKTQARPRVLAWEDLAKAVEPVRWTRIAAGHWMVPLRTNKPRTRFTSRGMTDRFLAYDVSLKMLPPVLLTPGQDQATAVSANAEFGPHAGGGVLLLRSNGDGVATTWVRVGPGEEQSVDFAKTAPEADPFAPLADQLKQRGFTPAEIGVALSIVRKLALESWGMSAVCMVTGPAMDALLPLTVEPAPAQIERVGLIVLTSIDPNIDNTIDLYISQLGNDQWAVRDAAQRALIDLGHAAIERVQANRNHQDPEVTHRVRQILDAYTLRYGNGLNADD